MVGSFHKQEGSLNSFTTINGQTWKTYLVSTTEANKQQDDMASKWSHREFLKWRLDKLMGNIITGQSHGFQVVSDA